VGGLIALGIHNGVLEPPAEPPSPDGASGPASASDECPHLGECYHCGVEGPPTHIRRSGTPVAGS
jgi:hypothetical protein